MPYKRNQNSRTNQVETDGSLCAEAGYINREIALSTQEDAAEVDVHLPVLY